MSLALALLSLLQTLAAPLSPPDDALPRCGQDAREPNDARSRAKSTRDRSTAAVTCATDADWFYVDAVRGERVEARFEHANDAHLAVEVFAPRRRKPLARSRPFSRGSRVGFAAPKSGRYRIRVLGEGKDDTPYTLRVIRRRAPGGG